MKNISKIVIAVFAMNFVVSCAFLEQFSQKQTKQLKPLNYLEKAPKVNIKNFLDGDLSGFAIIQDVNDKIENSFVVDVDGKWEGNKGTVRFNYVFNGGKKDSRTWLITVEDAENYTAIGHDFLSPAEGRQAGNTSQIIYTLRQIYKDKKEQIEFEDNLYLVDEDSAIIISEMRIGKTKLGKAIISLKKNGKSTKVGEIAAQ
ncbi:MAG TPA: DUF3833 family protein [Rickettsiales bacterium]|nr:DUF3833 family protein [Rickettsiales bacterium]